MASSKIPVVSFTGGEVDSKTLTQVNLDVAPQTAETMENLYLFTDGGMSLRPGTKYIGMALGQVILRPWSFSQDLSFALEIGAGAMRFIYDDGYVALEGAPATIGTFADVSGAPSSGGDPPLGGGALVVEVTETIWQNFVKGGETYYALGNYTATGGNGDYISPAVITIISGTVDDQSASDGFLAFVNSTDDPVTYTITVTDTNGASGTSAIKLIS